MKTIFIHSDSEILPDSSTDGLVLETTTVDKQQQCSIVHQSDITEMGNASRVSHLWSQPQETSSSEIPDAHSDPQIMEEYYGTKPTITKRKSVNSWKFNTR